MEEAIHEVSVVMALVDYIPVAFFTITAVLLMRSLYRKMPKYGFAMLAAGTINVFIAGFLKATWKLLYGAGICDFAVFNTMFMPTQSLGFFMAGLSLVILVCGKQKATLSVAAAPAVFKGTVIFLSMMVAGLGCVCSCLSILAARMKKKGVIALFVLCFVGSMGMGYLGSRGGTSALMNWLEQGINTLSQGALTLGVWLLTRAEKRVTA